jgi:hypothetical protein
MCALGKFPADSNSRHPEERFAGEYSWPQYLPWRAVDDLIFGCGVLPADDPFLAARARASDGAGMLVGGAGAGIFRFGGADSRARFPVADCSGDLILDFQQGQDKLDLAGTLKHFGTPPENAFLDSGGLTDSIRLQVRGEIKEMQTLVEIRLPFSQPGDAPLQGNAAFTLRGTHALVASDFILA